MWALSAAMAIAGLTPSAFAEPESPASSVSAPAGGEAEEKGLTTDQIEGLAALERASELLEAGENADTDEQRKLKYDESAKYAERAVELIPDNADAHFVLFGARGRVAQMGGLASAALALSSLNGVLDEVLRLDPDHPDALAARGGMLMKLPRLMGGNTTEGIRYLERATKINPNGAGTRLELAEAYEIVGRDNDALLTGRAALAIAENKGEDEKVERARAFVAELEKSCNDCALAAATK